MPCIKALDWTRDLILEIDASNFVSAGIPSQHDKDSILHSTVRPEYCTTYEAICVHINLTIAGILSSMKYLLSMCGLHQSSEMD